MSWIPGSGRSSRGGHGNPPQYSCLENPIDRGAWQATVHGSQRVRHDWSDLAHTVWNKLFWGYFFFNVFIKLFLATLGLGCCAQAFSNCGEGGLLSSCGSRTSYHGRFSCCRAQALVCVGFSHRVHELWSPGSVVVVHRLSCSTERGILSEQGLNPCPPCIGRLTLKLSLPLRGRVGEGCEWNKQVSTTENTRHRFSSHHRANSDQPLSGKFGADLKFPILSEVRFLAPLSPPPVPTASWWCWKESQDPTFPLWTRASTCWRRGPRSWSKTSTRADRRTMPSWPTSETASRSRWLIPPTYCRSPGKGRRCSLCET